MTDFGIVGKKLVTQLFPDEVGMFVDDVCETWDVLSSVPTLPAGTEEGISLSNRLRQLLPVSKGK